MSDDEQLGAIELPARSVPVPASVSAEAQAFLGLDPSALPEWPDPTDLEAWRALIAGFDRGILEQFSSSGLDTAPTSSCERIVAGGVPVFVLTPADVRADDPRVVLVVHGGALIMGGGECCRAMGVPDADRMGLRTWAIDYRMPPDHPYPAGLDDCVAVYRALLESTAPEHIVVRGGSAGGNLAAAMILRARDEGLPLPGAALLLTPELDLTESGDSFVTNLGLDTVLTRSLMPVNLLYAAGADLRDCYVSPLFGDVQRGFPPSLLAAGTRDLFLSNAVRFHRALRSAGLPADLHVIEAAPHGFFPTGPEASDLRREVREFIDRWCPAPRIPADAR